jgi:hypothetical protein
MDYEDFIVNMGESEICGEIENFLREFNPSEGEPVAAISEKIENALSLMKANNNFMKTGSNLEPVLQRQARELKKIITMLESKR